MPASDGGDDFLGIGGQDEGFRAFVVFGKEAVDGSLRVCCATISLSASASIRMSGDGVCSGDGRA